MIKWIHLLCNKTADLIVFDSSIWLALLLAFSTGSNSFAASERTPQPGVIHTGGDFYCDFKPSRLEEVNLATEMKSMNFDFYVPTVPTFPLLGLTWPGIEFLSTPKGLIFYGYVYTYLTTGTTQTWKEFSSKYDVSMSLFMIDDSKVHDGVPMKLNDQMKVNDTPSSNPLPANTPVIFETNPSIPLTSLEYATIDGPMKLIEDNITSTSFYQDLYFLVSTKVDPEQKDLNKNVGCSWLQRVKLKYWRVLP